MIEDIISGAKPMNLHPAMLSGDMRTYECSSCGDRFSDTQVDALGGVCPKDGAVFRPLGPFEKHHPEFRKNYLHKVA